MRRQLDRRHRLSAVGCVPGPFVAPAISRDIPVRLSKFSLPRPPHSGRKGHSRPYWPRQSVLQPSARAQADATVLDAGARFSRS